MPDNFFDINGNLLGTQKKASEPEEAPSSYFDLHGQPVIVGWGNHAPKMPLGGDFGGPSQLLHNAPLMVPMAISAIGGAIGTGLGGPAGGIAGAAGGSAIGEALKHLLPKTFSPDEESPSFGESALNVGADTITQGAIPAIAGKALGLLTKEGRTAAMASRMGQKFPAVQKSLTGSFINPVVNSGADIAEASAVKNVFSKGMSGDKITSPSAILKELDLTEHSISDETRKGIQNFLGNLPEKGTGSNILNYSKNRLILAAGPLALGVATGHAAATAATAGGILLTNEAIGKLLSNPTTSQLLLKAVKTGASAPEASLVQKALVYALRGSEVYFLGPDGKKEQAQISQSGQIQLPQP